MNLEIEGLNSFETKQIIDFENLSKYGIFGIFGKTGSGKSTVLDAITLALYGNIVRLESKKAEGIEELLNINSDRIYVKFEFELGEDKYVLERLYKRKKKKNESDKVEIGKKESRLIINEEQIYEKVREIKDKINEIIGLSLEDFTRAVVLPQGKFSEFLKLTGAERRDMLERIFSLEKYGKSLLTSINIEKNKYKSLINECNAKLSVNEEITVDKIKLIDEILEDKRKEKEIENNNYKEFELEYKEKEKIYELGKEKAEYEKKLQKLKSEEDSYKNKEDRLNKAKKSMEIKIMCKGYSQNEKEKLDYEKQQRDYLGQNKIEKEKLNIVAAKAKRAEENINKLRKLIKENRIDASQREKYKILERKLENYEEALVKIDTLKSEEESEKQKLKKIDFELENLNNEEKKLQESISKIYNVDEKKLDELKKKIYQLDYEYDKYTKLEKELIEKEEKYTKILEMKKSIDTKIKMLQEKLAEYILEEKNSAAYLLSKDLSEGQKCMVCGSTHHPDLFHMKESIQNINQAAKERQTCEKEIMELRIESEKYNISELEKDIKELKMNLGNKTANIILEEKNKIEEESENLEKEKILNEKTKLKLEKLTNDLKENKNNIEKEILIIKSKLENKKDELEKNKIIVEGTIKFYRENAIEYLENNKISVVSLKTKIQDLRRREKEIEKLQEEEEKAYNEFKKISIEEESIAKNISEKEIFIEKNKIEINHLQQLLEKQMSEIDDEIEKMGFLSREEVKDYYLKEEELIKLERDINDYKEKLNNTTIVFENLSKQLEKEEISDVEWLKLKEKQKTYLERIENFIKEIERLNTEKENMEKVWNEKKQILKEKEELHKKHDIIEDLAKLMSGNKFVEFLAINKLKKISREASERLKKITNGRYILCLDKAGEFLIRDNFNGGVERKVNTLSGGETFLTSLSLALALSSHIQLKGKIRLEFFFLDEGFGTLDAELLDKVVNSLEKLTMENIKVGFISHVEELKTRIPMKIEILEAIPGERGSIVS